MQAPQEGAQWGRLIAAARLSEKASIGNGFWKSAHGGAVGSSMFAVKLSALELLGILPAVLACYVRLHHETALMHTDQ